MGILGTAQSRASPDAQYCVPSKLCVACRDMGAGETLTVSHLPRSYLHSRGFLLGPIPGAAWAQLSGNPATNRAWQSLGVPGGRLHLNQPVSVLVVGFLFAN